jgi:transposase-like protein
MTTEKPKEDRLTETEWDWAEKRFKNTKLRNPNLCLFCDSEDLEGEGVDIDGIFAHQSVSCNSCGSDWTETYRRESFSMATVTKDGADTLRKRMTKKVKKKS